MKKYLLTVALTVLFLIVGSSSVEAASYQFLQAGQSDSITCQVSDVNCQWQSYVVFQNVYGDFIFETTAFTSSPNNMLKYYSWNKGLTSEQDVTYRSTPVEPNHTESIVVNMRNPGVPGVYRGTIYLDGKSCNRNTTPWDCYYQGAGSFTITMTVVGNPTATPTTPPPTATPTTRPPSATATPTGSQPTLTPTPTTPSGQATPTPTSGVTSPTPTSSTSQTTANNTTNSGTADSAGTQAKPKTCSATVPNAPKLLLIKPVSQTSVTLEWSEVANASHYAVSYGTKSGSYLYGISNTGKTTSFTVKSLGKNSVYYFVVQAISDCAPSKISNELSTEVNQALPEKSVEEIIADVESSKSAIIDDRQSITSPTENQENQIYPLKQLLLLVVVGFGATVAGFFLLVKKSPMNPITRFIIKMIATLTKFKQ